MSLKKVFGLMTLAVVAGGPWMVSRASATAVVPMVAVMQDGSFVSSPDAQYSITGNTFSGTGSSSGNFSWSFSGDTDPLINWSFSASTPGTYTVIFSAPVFGGPYTIMKNQAALAISDIGAGTSPTSVTGVSIAGEDPTGTPIAGETLTGDLTVANGLTGNINPYGPLTSIGTFSAPSFAEVLTFTLTSADGDGSAAFSGQLILTPEPTSLGLLALGASGLLLKRKR